MTANILVKKRNGRLEDLNIEKINKCAERACEGLVDVSASEVVLDAHVQLYNKVTTTEIDQALIYSARSKIEKEPNYSYVAARLLLNNIYKEVFAEGADSDVFQLQYRKAFIVNLKKLVKAGRINPKLLDFDLKVLSEAIQTTRDKGFKYFGIQTLYDRYFIHINGRRMETPQAFWMRVAMGLAINEQNKEERAIEFYTVLSEFRGCQSTPTLFNSGTNHSQLSSCYLNTFDDSIDGIFEGLWQEARKSKFAGGLGFDVTPWRGATSYIHGTNGISTGVVPWLKIYNSMLVAVDQGSKRPGAGCAYLETWHIDIEDFLDLKKNTGDERRRCHDMNTANWIPDLFMKQVATDGDWYLFSPNEVPDLHELYGPAFEKAYWKYVKKAESGDISIFRKVSAKELWKKMLKALYETGHPWITFKDAANLRYSNQHVGVVHSSNLCTEIFLHTIASEYKDGVKSKVGETAVCNLGSINLRTHIVDGKIDKEMLAATIKTQVRMLDNVIDLNYYPTQESRNSNLKHRPIGGGSMGWADMIHAYGLDYSSPEAVKLSDEIQEFISYHTILNDSLLAKERGKYSTYEGSLWSQGILPIDTWKSLMSYRAVTFDPEKVSSMDWDTVREHIKEHGMRNSNVMAIAPTATISFIQGCSEGVGADFSCLFVNENKSGNFFIINEYLVAELKALGLWTNSIIQNLKAADGDLSLLDVPDDIKKKFRTAFQQDQSILIDCAAARQKWIDMGQSLNLFNNSESLKALNDIYFHAWQQGLKSTYYLRNKSASKVEKSNRSEVKAQTVCSIENGAACEACQ